MRPGHERDDQAAILDPFDRQVAGLDPELLPGLPVDGDLDVTDMNERETGPYSAL